MVMVAERQSLLFGLLSSTGLVDCIVVAICAICVRSCQAVFRPIFCILYAAGLIYPIYPRLLCSRFLL